MPTLEQRISARSIIEFQRASSTINGVAPMGPPRAWSPLGSPQSDVFCVTSSCALKTKKGPGNLDLTTVPWTDLSPANLPKSVKR